MKKIAIVLFFSLLFFSCGKEWPLIVENTDILLLSKVLIGGESCMEYMYNDANLLTEEKSKFHYTKHNYSHNNLLSTSEFYMDPAMFSSNSTVVEASMNRKEWVNPDNTAKSLTKGFEYDGNEQLTRITFSRPSVSNSEFSEYTIENGRIIRQTMYWQNVKSYYIDYKYDENGNLTKESKYYVSSSGNEELLTTNEYEYDNMHNPFQAFKRLMAPGKYTNPNNILKDTYTIFFEVDQWTQKVQITNNSYKYNDSGYPVQVNGEAEYVYRGF